MLFYLKLKLVKQKYSLQVELPLRKMRPYVETDSKLYLHNTAIGTRLKPECARAAAVAGALE